MAVLGLLGTTISPYMLFGQANQEVEEARGLNIPDEGAAKRSVVIGMVLEQCRGVLHHCVRGGHDSRDRGC